MKLPGRFRRFTPRRRRGIPSWLKGLVGLFIVWGLVNFGLSIWGDDRTTGIVLSYQSVSAPSFGRYNSGLPSISAELVHLQLEDGRIVKAHWKSHELPKQGESAYVVIERSAIWGTRRYTAYRND